MPSSILLALVGCNLVWACNPVFSKALLRDFGPLQVAWLRYGSALLVALPLLILPEVLARGRGRFGAAAGGGLGSTRFLPSRILPGGVRAWGTVAVMGLGAFFLTPALQTTGLHRSQALDNVLIVALEPLVSIALAAILFRERMKGSQFLSLLLALIGFALLSGLIPFARAAAAARSLGNGLIFLSLGGEALYTVLGSRLAATSRPIGVFSASLMTGFSALTLLTVFSEGLPSLAALGAEQWLAVFWVGPLGTALTYSFWIAALRSASVSAVALTLFVQPVCGALIALVTLGESLGGARTLGAVIILLTVFWPLFSALRMEARQFISRTKKNRTKKK
jgi:drug/metabolite transporter (DMT)-like permease